MMEVEFTKRFEKIIKKMHVDYKKNLDNAIRMLMEKPALGELKVGDLAGVRVYKFEINNQKQALAYIYEESIPKITLLTLGTHENFYRDLKNYIKSR